MHHLQNTVKFWQRQTKKKSTVSSTLYSLDTLILSTQLYIPYETLKFPNHFHLNTYLQINVRALNSYTDDNTLLWLRLNYYTPKMWGQRQLPAKQHCQSSPFTSKLRQIGQVGSAVQLVAPKLPPGFLFFQWPLVQIIHFM